MKNSNTLNIINGKHRTVFFFMLVLFCSAKFCFAQTDSISIQGIYRIYIVHLPPNYSNATKYSLVLNFHGLNSSATQQQVYTNFDAVADTAKLIVVYPQGYGNSWNLSGTTSSPNDSLFISALMDKLIQKYSIDIQRIFATGMSLGGFMCYNLACQFEDRIAAIAVVSGNMSDLTKLFATISHPVPIMHIHGTADLIVNYNGTFGVSSVPNTVLWWAQKNYCNTTPVTTALPNPNLGDSCTVEMNYYAPGLSSDSCEVLFLKINNGGHTWPGAFPIVIFGNTCQDFYASGSIWNFFNTHRLKGTPSGIDTKRGAEKFKLFPDPANEIISFKLKEDQKINCVSVYNACGVEVIHDKILSNNEGVMSIDVHLLTEGIYYLFIETNSGSVVKEFVRKDK